MQRARPLLLLVGLVAAPLGLPACGRSEALVDGRTSAQWQARLADAALPDEERRRAVVALADCGEGGFEPLLGALRDPSPRVVEAALAALGRRGDGRAAARVAPLLASADPTTVAHAAGCLARLGPPAADAVAPLAAHADEGVRERALDVLRATDPSSPRTRDVLVRATGDVAWTVRRKAYAGLGPHARQDASVVALLDRGLEDANPFVVREALVALGEAGPAALALRPRLEERLAAEVGPVRAAAARALARLGTAARASLPAVERALAREPGVARVALLEARWGLTGDTAAFLEGLREVLRGAGDLALEALAALGPLGGRAAPAVPEVAALLGDRGARLAAVDRLATIGEGAAAAVPALEALAADPNPALQERVAAALARIRAAGRARGPR